MPRPPPALALLQHNEYRAKHGAANLTWSDTITKSAYTWSSGCQFAHSPSTYGEVGTPLPGATDTGLGGVQR